MKKRMVAILLCVAMVAVSLTACGNSDKANNKDNVSVSLNSETDTSNNKNSSKAEQKEKQIDYIQAEYRIIDAKELYVTADNMEATTDSDGNETYINTENYTNQDVCDNRDKETVLQQLMASLCGIAGAIDLDTARNEGVFDNVTDDGAMEPVAFVGVPCTDENGVTLGDTAPIFRKVFENEVLNDLFAFKPDYELVEVDGEDDKWYKFTWSPETTYEGIYAEAYLQELAGRKSELQTAVKEANNGSDAIELTVSPETVAKCLDKYNLDEGYWFAFNDLEDYNANSWNYGVIYDGVRYTSTVTNDNVKIMLEVNGEPQTVIMQQWYTDLLLDKNPELTTKEEVFFGSEKYQSIAYSEGRMLKLEQNQKAAFEACGFKIDDYR